eukprot:scaffold77905_cov58-Attheya_sp.AAC.3
MSLFIEVFTFGSHGGIEPAARGSWSSSHFESKGLKKWMRNGRKRLQGMVRAAYSLDEVLVLFSSYYKMRKSVKQ